MAKQPTTDRKTARPADDGAPALKTGVRRSTVPADAAVVSKAAARDSATTADDAHATRASDRSLAPPTDADALAFRAAVRDVKPLQQTWGPAGIGPPTARIRRKAAARRDGPGRYDSSRHDSADEALHAMPLVASDEAPTIAAGDRLTFQRPGVRNQVLRKLRRGLYPIEDELDLHGLSQSAARDQLAAFLAHNRDAARRCVRIIHGKGYRSGTRGPVLKIAVDSWLRRHTDVMAFESARPIDGGTGAVYVLLRA